MPNYKHLIAYLGQPIYRHYPDRAKYISDDEIYTQYGGDSYWGQEFAKQYSPKFFKLTGSGKNKDLTQKTGVWGYISLHRGKLDFDNHGTGTSLSPEYPASGGTTQFTLFDTETGNIYFCRVPIEQMQEVKEFLDKQKEAK